MFSSHYFLLKTTVSMDTSSQTLQTIFTRDDQGTRVLQRAIGPFLVAETLVIHLHGQEELQASWRPLYTGEEQPQGPAGNGSLAEAAVQAKGRQVIVFVALR